MKHSLNIKKYTFETKSNKNDGCYFIFFVAKNNNKFIIKTDVVKKNAV